MTLALAESSEVGLKPEVIYPVRILEQRALGDAHGLRERELESANGRLKDL